MDYAGKIINKNPVTPSQTSASGVWTVDDVAAAVRTNTWPVAGVPNPISKSLRFNNSDNAFLNRTPASASNRKTWTWSGWVKRSRLGAQQGLIGCSVGTSDSTYMNLQFHGGDFLGLGLYTQYVLLTTQVFRDASAWYHIVVAFDTTNATANNRCRMYVNGVEITAFSTRNNPTLNADYGINQASQHDIGRSEYTNSTCLGGYLTEVNFIDGQALTPSSFGMTDPVTGVWEPLKYSGTYGTNGFYLNFKDATSTTTLGLDYSGNSNTWTTNNFSVTAGVGNDSMTDVPTPWIVYNTTGDVGGVVRGNYATLNQNFVVSSTTFSNGNLQITKTADIDVVVPSTIAVSSGKWYWEVTPTVLISASNFAIGIVKNTKNTGTWDALLPSGIYFGGGGNVVKYGSAQTAATLTVSANNVLGIALDMDNGSITITKNGSSVTNGTVTGVDTTIPHYAFVNTYENTESMYVNFGQRPFAYTPPSGFLSLCTTNLPASTVLKGSEYFNAVLYTGTGSPLSVTGVGFKPDWVWAKKRSATDDHVTSDALRGVQKDLTPNSTAAEATNTNGLQSFDSDGFSIGSGSGSGVWGGNSGATYVAWNWKASNAAGVTNTAGSITSTVSANTTSGFSIVTYTGTGSAGATIGHGIGIAPSMIIFKRRNGVTDWQTYHISLGNATDVYLNLTNAAASAPGMLNSTTPTSTLITLGTSTYTNANTGTFVAYCFAPISGFSAFGSYTGNGSADGPFVYLGFRPKFWMGKRTDSTSSWIIMDSSRNTYNVIGEYLLPNSSNAEASATIIDFLSNGVKFRGTSNNDSGSTWIYAAFAENPFKNALAR